MFTGFHWYDLLPCLFIVLVVAAIVIFGLAIGRGYAQERRRQEQHPDEP